MVNNYQNGVIAQLLQAIIGQINFDGTPTSNIGDILLSILEQTPYDKEPKSVLAELFLKLKDKLEGRAFTPYDKEPKSAIAEILLSILNETEYDKEPNSRIAELLLELKSELESYAELTASGAIANFTTSVVKPLVNLTAYFKATQEAGTPTPQSPKAISGVSALNVFHRGANLFDGQSEQGSYDSTTGEKISSSSLKRNISPISVKPNTTYKRIIDTSLGVRIFYYDKNMHFINSESSSNAIITFTTPLNCGFINIAFQNAVTGLAILYPTSLTEFEPYNGSTTLINLGGTYYGGYVSQDKDGKRELTVTHSGLINLNELEAYYKSTMGVGIFYAELPNGLIKSGGGFNIDGLCTTYLKTNTTGLPNDLMCRFYSHSDWNFSRIAIRDDEKYNALTVEEFKAQVQGAIMYEIAEPFTVALPDGVPIVAFNGVNNVYNDSGDTSVTYLAKIEDNLNATAKFRAEVKAQKEKAKEELKEDVKEDVKELEPIKDSGEKKRGA